MITSYREPWQTSPQEEIPAAQLVMLLPTILFLGRFLWGGHSSKLLRFTSFAEFIIESKPKVLHCCCLLHLTPPCLEPLSRALSYTLLLPNLRAVGQKHPTKADAHPIPAHKQFGSVHPPWHPWDKKQRLPFLISQTLLRHFSLPTVSILNGYI